MNASAQDRVDSLPGRGVHFVSEPLYIEAGVYTYTAKQRRTEAHRGLQGRYITAVYVARIRRAKKQPHGSRRGAFAFYRFLSVAAL